MSDRLNDVGNFDLSDPANPTIFVPKGQTAQLTPYIAQYVKISATGSRGLINSDLNNFAPRIGLAWQFTPEDRVAHGLWHFLRRAGERAVLESESRIQSSVLHERVVHFSLRRADGERCGGRLPS